MATIASMIVALGLDNSSFTRGIRESAREFQSFDRTVAQGRDEMGRFTKAATPLGQTLRALGGGLAAGLGAAGFGVALRNAAAAASEFGLAMAEVSTLLDDTSAIPELEASVKALSIEFGKAPVEEVRALYQIISSGATSAAQATEILAAANRASVAGLTDVATAADGLTTILNAYGPSAGTAADVSDALFVAMRAGKTTIQQLAESIGTVAPLAAQAGVSLEETLAAASALTKGGIDTRVAMTGLRATLASIIKPSKEATDLAARLGIEFNASGLAAQGLGGFLETLRAKTGGNVELMSQLVGGVEALAPVLSLTGTQAQSLADIMASMGDKAGEAQAALDKISGTPAQQFAKLRAAFSVLAVDMGAKILKIALPAVEALNKNFRELVSIAVAVGKAVGVAAASFALFKAASLAAALVPTVAAFLALIPAISGVSSALTLAGIAAKGFLVGLGPIGVAVAVIGALAAIFYKQGEAAREAAAATDEYARSLISMSKTQLGARTAELESQLAALKAQQAVVDQMASVAVSDATGTRRTASRSTARETQEAARLTQQITTLETQLEATKAAFEGAFDADAMNAEIDAIITGIGTLGSETTKTKTAFELLEESAITALDTLAIVQERSDLVSGWADALPRAFAEAESALAEVERRIADQEFTGAVDANLVALANTIRTRISDASRNAFQPLLDAAADAIRRAAALAEGGFGDFAQDQALTVLRTRYAEVTREIRLQGGPLKANLDLLERANALTKAIAERSGIEVIDKKALEDAVKLIELIADRGLEDIEEHLDRLTVDFGEMATAVADMAAGILTVADALGGLDNDTRRALEGVLQLAEGIERISQGDLIGGAAGAIAGGINLIGGLAGLGGPDPEIVAALDENSRRLREVAAGLDRFPTTGTDVAAALRASEFIARQNAALGVPDTAVLTGLDPILQAFGISLERLNEIAEAEGITLLDDQGRAIAGAFEDLTDVLGYAVPRLTEFANTIDGARDRQELLNRVSGVTLSPSEVLQQQVDLLGQFLAPANGFMPDQLNALFRDVDASTAEGRAQIQAGLQELAGIIADGGLTLEQLGQFADVDELVPAILAVQDALDALPAKVTAFGSTLDAQRTRLDLRARLFGEDSPAEAIRRELDLLAQFAPEIAAQFAGLDAVTEQGREQIRQALQALFLNIEAGLLSEEALGQLAGLEELIGIITNVDTALDGFAETARAADAALRNVPEGFKLALRSFESSLAETRAPATVLDTLAPFPATAPIFDPAPLDSGGVTLSMDNVEITIVAGDRDAAELTDEIVAELRTRSLAAFGTTTRAAEVL